MTSAIVVEALGKDYRAPATLGDLARGRLRGRAVTALSEVSLTLEAGQGVAILGRNGAGKSTLLKCLAGLLLPTRGRAVVFGHDCARAGAALRRDAVYVAADPRSFAWRLSAGQNLEFFAALHGWSRDAARRRAGESLEAVSLDGEASRRVSDLSTGMRQRLAIARALLGEPKLLLLDEPTAGLDARSAREVRELVRARGACVVVATHSLDDAAALAASAVVLEAGRVAWRGDIEGARGRVEADA